jgi:Right handed beta helix region
MDLSEDVFLISKLRKNSNTLHIENRVSMYSSRLSRTATISIAMVLLCSLFLARVAPVYASPACVAAGGTGLTAKMVVSTGSHGHGEDSGHIISDLTVNATGCDVGIYIAPGSSGVILRDVTVTGANDHGILVQDASHVVIMDSVVMGNGIPNQDHSCPTPRSPPPCIHENKALQMVGTSDSIISHNLVKGNGADGGIGVADDGPDSVGGDPAALTASATSPFPSQNVKVIGNVVVDNSNGCGIIVAGYDANVGVKDVEVRGNTVIGAAPGTAPFGGPGSFDGQIIVAGDGPFATVSDVTVANNNLDGSLLPGIVLHANVFGDSIVDTVIRGNTLSDNGWYPSFFVPPGDTNTPVSPNTTGISIVAEVGQFPPTLGPAPAISHTTVDSNTVLNDHTGVWLCGTSQTSIEDLDGNPVVPTATCPAGGT